MYWVSPTDTKEALGKKLIMDTLSQRPGGLGSAYQKLLSGQFVRKKIEEV